MRRSCHPGRNSIPGVSHDTGILSHRDKIWQQNSNIGFFSSAFFVEIFPSRLISLTLMVLIFLDLGHSFGFSTSLLL